MKKVLLGLAAVVFIALLGFFGAAAMQPDQVHVERKVVADATPADVFPFANDMTKFVEWSPWSELDPDMEVDYTDSTTGVGASYHWKGNDQVGEGRMTIVSSEEPTKVVHDLEFIEPFPSVAQATVSVVEQDDKVEITWAYDQDADMGTKMMTLFMDMDEMLGPDFEKGLGYLQDKVEAAAAEREEAEAKAAAEAAEAAARAAEAAERGEGRDAVPTPLTGPKGSGPRGGGAQPPANAGQSGALGR